MTHSVHGTDALNMTDGVIFSSNTLALTIPILHYLSAYAEICCEEADVYPTTKFDAFTLGACRAVILLTKKVGTSLIRQTVNVPKFTLINLSTKQRISGTNDSGGN